MLFVTGAVLLSATAVHAFNDTLTQHRQAQRNTSDGYFRTVVIDAGHGGRDFGCLGADHNEKTLALDMALSLGGLIEARQPDVRVIYTRESDVFVPLYKRAEIANSARADLFISIHCNALANHSGIHGSETYVMGLHTAEQNLNVAKRENEAIRLEENYDQFYDFDPNSPTGHIILSMHQHAHLEESLTLASDIESQMANREGRRSRGVKQAGFVVLKATTMPSVLVETGYLTNPAEEVYLANRTGQLETAEAMYRGFVQYLRRQRLQAGTEIPQLASQHVSVSAPPLTLIEDKYTEPEALRTTVGPSVAELEKKARESTIEYYVQLAAARKAIPSDDPRWATLSLPVRYLREGQYFKYQLGPVSTREALARALAEAKRKGFTDAFTIGYKDGVKVEVK